WPGLTRPSTRHRDLLKTWMPGSSPGMTAVKRFANGSCGETELHPADEERIALDLVAPRLRGLGHLRDITHAKIESAHDIRVALDVSERRVRQLQLGCAICAFRHGNTDDLAPVLGQIIRIRALHLHAG